MVWDDVEDYLKAAVEEYGSRYTLASTREGLERGEYQLWMAYSTDAHAVIGAVVTTVTLYPRGRWLCCLFAGGERLNAWKDAARDAITNYARALDCIGIQTSSRDGWGRVFNAKKVYTVWEVRLDQ